MADIRPQNLALLTDDDVEYANFKCCGDEDLVFLRCPPCGHISVLCYECDTWYINLDKINEIRTTFLSDVNQRLRCSHCDHPFEDFYFLKEKIVDKYLPTAKQVIDAGYGRHLASHFRKNFGINI
jgi:hypothetical protein